MQVGIPVAYSVCEVKLDKINHWICVYREDFSSCDGILKTQATSRISYRVCKTNPTFNLYFNPLAPEFPFKF